MILSRSPSSCAPAGLKLPVLHATSLLFTLWITHPASAQQADTARAFRDSVVVRQKLISQGREVFHGEGTCFACHGAKLEGTAIAPTLRAHKWRNGDGSLDMILRVIHTGVPKTAMVPHPGNINENEIQQVAAYVWAVSRGVVPP